MRGITASYCMNYIETDIKKKSLLKSGQNSEQNNMKGTKTNDRNSVEKNRRRTEKKK